MILRDYQQAGLQAIDDAYTRGVRSMLLAMATGAGKTVVFADLVSRRPGRALILAHRDRLIQQATEKLEAIIPRHKIGIVKAEMNQCAADIVVASVQTLARSRRLATMPVFDTVIVDECHRSAAVTYRRILDHVRHQDTLLLGVTATPSRADGIGLSEIYEEIVHEVGLLQLIEEGYLAPLRGQKIYIAADFSGLHTKTNTEGINDYRQDEVVKLMNQADWYKHVTEGWLKCASDRRTLAFVPPGKDDDGRSTAMAFQLADYMRERGVSAVAVNGESNLGEQRRVIRDFEAGHIQVITNCDLFTEGLDIPSINCIDAETEVLTPSGWAGINDHIETVVTLNTCSGHLEALPAQAKVIQMWDGDVVYSESSRYNFRVTGNHRMLVGIGRRTTPMAFRPARELPSLERFRLPLSGISDNKEIDISDDELRLIAWFMTDGNWNKTNLYIGQAKPEQVLYIRALLNRLGLQFGEHVSNNDRGYGKGNNFPLHRFFIPRGVKGSCKGRGWDKLCAYLDKDGSPLLMNISPRQFAVFWNELLRGDGNGDARITRERLLIVVNDKMLAWLQAVACQAGFATNATLNQILPSEKKVWFVHISDRRYQEIKPQDRRRAEPFICSQQLTKPERFWCVQNPNGTLIIRRQGKVCVVGNCILFARPTKSQIVYAQAIGRGTRRSDETGKTDCLVLDLVGASNKFDLCTLGSLFGIKSLKDGEDVRKAIEREKKEHANEVAKLEEMLRVKGEVRAQEIDLFGGVKPLKRQPPQQEKKKLFDWIIHRERKQSFLISGGHEFMISKIGDTYTYADLSWSGKFQGQTRDYNEAKEECEAELRRKLFGDKDAPWRGKPASEKQIALLAKFKIPVKPDITKGEASDLLDAKFSKKKGKEVVRI